MIVQTLAQSGSLGFVVSDPILAMGINMPFRSTCILGYKDSIDFEIHSYLQMIGRSGRRGQDREGHIIYANVHWNKLMKGELEDLDVAYPNIDNYKVLSKLNTVFEGRDIRVYDNIYNKPVVNNNVINTKFYEDELSNRLLWKGRIYNKSIRYFIDNLLSLEMEYRRPIDTLSNREFAIKMSNIFIDNLEFTEYLVSSMITNKFTNNSIFGVHVYNFTHIIRDLHNIIMSDDTGYFNNICANLAYLFSAFQTARKITSLLCVLASAKKVKNQHHTTKY